jgi:uncharacterized protein (TIGR00369 family)
MAVNNLEDNKCCFVCGPDNPEGLKLQFHYREEGKKVSATFVPPKKFQGWKDMVHGGIIVTLLDEVMAKAAQKSGYAVLTGEIQTRFKNPARVLEPLRLEAEIENVRRKIVYARATAFREDGAVIAEAKSKMFLI